MQKKTNPKPATKPAAKKTAAKPRVKKPNGNQFWKLRSKHGRDKLFATPQLLWEAACEYFQWVQDNPLYETKVFNYQGIITSTEVPVMRAMTMRGLCFFLNCNEGYFRQFKSTLSDDNDEIGFSTVISDIENTIYQQKFEGAAGNLLNANIISRDLGLADKKDLTSNGETMSFANFLMQSSEDEQAD